MMSIIKCFEVLKIALCKTPLLKLPDFTKPFVVEADTSNQTVGAVLLYLYYKELYPIALFNKKYYPVEINNLCMRSC